MSDGRTTDGVREPRARSVVLGRSDTRDAGPTARLGRYRAIDGSDGAGLWIDLDRPHAALVVGKRGFGKSYTLGVLAEELARAGGVAPVVIDPMGVFRTLAAGTTDPTAAPVPATVVSTPSVAPEVLDPKSWCGLLGLAPDSGAGALVWAAARASSTVDGMIDHVQSADAAETDQRAAANYLSLANSWGAFDPNGLSAEQLATPEVTVIDVSGMDSAPTKAVARGIAEVLYRARIDQQIDRLPWLLVDEAHALFDGIARPAFETLLTRGRSPGVSLVAATQRPSAAPAVLASQADLLLSHRLTARADIEALQAVRPSYAEQSLTEQMPTDPGEVIVVDDTTETVHTARVRQRDTPHGGSSPRASEVDDR